MKKNNQGIYEDRIPNLINIAEDIFNKLFFAKLSSREVKFILDKVYEILLDLPISKEQS